MTPFMLYRAVASLSRIEGLSHILRVSLAEGYRIDAAAALVDLQKDLNEAKQAVETLAREPKPEVD